MQDRQHFDCVIAHAKDFEEDLLIADIGGYTTNMPLADLVDGKASQLM